MTGAYLRDGWSVNACQADLTNPHVRAVIEAMVKRLDGEPISDEQLAELWDRLP